jgi:hypothetical protein
MNNGTLTLALAALLGAASMPASSQPGAGASLPDSTGTGPFSSIKEVDAGLPDQVVYRPADLDALGDTKLGIYAFGNGGCSDDAASARQHLLEIASHGYVAIAPGRIYSGPGAIERPPGPPRNPGDDAPTRPEQLREAIDWVLAENERPGSHFYNRIDTDAIAASGFSCGGIQALVIAADPRIETVIVMNSGLFIEGDTVMGGMTVPKSQLGDLHYPTLYVLGGPSDIAYENGMDDVAKIDHVPIAVANIDKGHGGTYAEPNGGAAAEVVVDWLEWQLRGDTEAQRAFLGADCGLCTDPEWEYETKNFDLLD